VLIKGSEMSLLRKVAAVYAIILAFVALLNYIPGLTDDQGRTFGIFALDIFDDLLHVFSATWAAVSAWMSHRASKFFLRWFGLIYFIDGLIGLYAGSGIIDLGIFKYGVLDQTLFFNFLASLPHIVLGGAALLASLFLDRERA
jgi:hypothetical protein